MRRTFWAVIAGVVALWTAVPVVYGQEATIIQEQVVAPNTKYMAGGVGLEERSEMRTLAKQGYDLKLEFAVPHGNYLSIVEVRINDPSGRQVISAESHGPWFYAQLPKGTYTVVASHEGVQKTQKVTVGGGLKTVVMYFTNEQPGLASGKREVRAGASERRRQGSQTPAKPANQGKSTPTETQK